MCAGVYLCGGVSVYVRLYVCVEVCLCAGVFMCGLVSVYVRVINFNGDDIL